ncbi:cupin domain-containing protein [Thermodesulfobacteriota bacterium]
MSNIKYFTMAGQGTPVQSPAEPENARINAVWMDGTMIEGCMFNEASWYMMPCREPGLRKHNSDKMMFFIGGNPDKPESLNATVDMWIENDKLTLTNTCAVFVPRGTAHGNLEIKDLETSLFRYTCHINTDIYDSSPAEATAGPGTYANYYVERYERPDGTIPEAPEGFIKFLVYLNGERLKGAPYAEAIWFCTTNDTGPAPHSHNDFDEFIGFIGSDPERPEELNGEISFYVEGEKISLTKSCLVYIPRGVEHSPILVPKLEKPILHFSGGNGSHYAREGDENRDDNMFKL